MTTPLPNHPGATGSRVVEWRPGLAGAVLLNVLAVPLLLIGLAGYLVLAASHLPRSGVVTFVPLELLGLVLLTLVLTGVLLVAHEGLHGLAMAAFGARPRFGAMMIAGLAPALYTTAPGHRFSRAEYLAVTLTPVVAISTLGAVACLTPVGLVLVLPLAFHLAGCVGDLGAALRLAREPRGTGCEDLRDGIRFHRPAAWAAAGE
jgi:Putative zincin peptidase